VDFSLIVCTYQRPKSLLTLLESLEQQTVYPNQVIIVDGSIDKKTSEIFKKQSFTNLEYFLVKPDQRGLTKQRNFGIDKLKSEIDIVFFLDDDIVLTKDYFSKILKSYHKHPEALGIGGYILDGTSWFKTNSVENESKNYFYLEHYKRKDSSRFILRKKLGLLSNKFPTFMPEEGHPRSVGFIPPTGKTYFVETFMGGVASYRKEVFEKIKFSSYFLGYGLYEDTDFTLRCSKIGKLYLNTAAQLYHFHNEDGRPNQFKYGKMVVRNGWYVWRVRHPKPALLAVIKWHLISLVLIGIRFSNVLTSRKKKQALSEALGRLLGWFSLFLKKPKV
jgi:GT2 family glycosyltransferase